MFMTDKVQHYDIIELCCHGNYATFYKFVLLFWCHLWLNMPQYIIAERQFLVELYFKSYRLFGILFLGSPCIFAILRYLGRVMVNDL